MSAATFRAAIPEPFRILGLRLKPFSLGRYRLLRRLDCAFVSEEPALPKPGDLFLGVYICSKRCDEMNQLLESGECWPEMEQWGKSIFGDGPEPEAFNYLEKVTLFKRYLSESAEVPKYWEEDCSNMHSGGHWSQSVEIVLRGELNWTSEEIDEAPLSKAISDYHKWLEGKGAIRLMSDYEIQLCEDLERAAKN